MPWNLASTGIGPLSLSYLPSRCATARAGLQLPDGNARGVPARQAAYLPRNREIAPLASAVVSNGCTLRAQRSERLEVACPVVRTAVAESPLLLQGGTASNADDLSNGLRWPLPAATSGTPWRCCRRIFSIFDFRMWGERAENQEDTRRVRRSCREGWDCVETSAPGVFGGSTLAGYGSSKAAAENLKADCWR